MTSSTLVLERLLLAPGFEEAAARWHAAVPTAERDQADAAIAHAREVAYSTADRIGAVASGTTKAANLPGWLRLALLDALAGFMDGVADTCSHAPVPSSPQPVMAAAWRPGLIVCTGCTHLLPQRRGSAADRTCDACGRVCAGTPDDPIHPGLLTLSILLFEYGTCSDCKPPHPPTVATSPRSTTTAETEGVRTTASPSRRRPRGRGRR